MSTFRVDVRGHGSVAWIPWSSTPDAEAAFLELRRCALGFDARIVSDDGTVLVAIVDGGRKATDRRAGVPIERKEKTT